MQELKRVINYKKLILIAIIALVNIIFFLYANKPVTDEGILTSEKMHMQAIWKNIQKVLIQ